MNQHYELEKRAPNQSYHDYYREHVDFLINNATRKSTLHKFAVLTHQEFPKDYNFTPQQLEDLTIHFSNFRDLVDWLSLLSKWENVDFFERRGWTKESVKTIMDVITALDTQE